MPTNQELLKAESIPVIEGHLSSGVGSVVVPSDKDGYVWESLGMTPTGAEVCEVVIARKGNGRKFKEVFGVNEISVLDQLGVKVAVFGEVPHGSTLGESEIKAREKSTPIDSKFVFDAEKYHLSPDTEKKVDSRWQDRAYWLRKKHAPSILMAERRSIYLKSKIEASRENSMGRMRLQAREIVNGEQLEDLYGVWSEDLEKQRKIHREVHTGVIHYGEGDISTWPQKVGKVAGYAAGGVVGMGSVVGMVSERNAAAVEVNGQGEEVGYEEFYSNSTPYHASRDMSLSGENGSSLGIMPLGNEGVFDDANIGNQEDVQVEDGHGVGPVALGLGATLILSSFGVSNKKTKLALMGTGIAFITAGCTSPAETAAIVNNDTVAAEAGNNHQEVGDDSAELVEDLVSGDIAIDEDSTEEPDESGEDGEEVPDEEKTPVAVDLPDGVEYIEASAPGYGGEASVVEIRAGSGDGMVDTSIIKEMGYLPLAVDGSILSYKLFTNEDGTSTQANTSPLVMGYWEGGEFRVATHSEENSIPGVDRYYGEDGSLRYQVLYRVDGIEEGLSLVCAAESDTGDLYDLLVNVDGEVVARAAVVFDADAVFTTGPNGEILIDGALLDFEKVLTQREVAEVEESERVLAAMAEARDDELDSFMIDSPYKDEDGNTVQVRVDVVPEIEITEDVSWSWDYGALYREMDEADIYWFKNEDGVDEAAGTREVYRIIDGEPLWLQIISEMEVPESGLYTIEVDDLEGAIARGFDPSTEFENPDVWAYISNESWRNTEIRQIADPTSYVEVAEVVDDRDLFEGAYDIDSAVKKAGSSMVIFAEPKETMLSVALDMDGESRHRMTENVDSGRMVIGHWYRTWDSDTGKRTHSFNFYLFVATLNKVLRIENDAGAKAMVTGVLTPHLESQSVVDYLLEMMEAAGDERVSGVPGSSLVKVKSEGH